MEMDHQEEYKEQEIAKEEEKKQPKNDVEMSLSKINQILEKENSSKNQDQIYHLTHNAL